MHAAVRLTRENVYLTGLDLSFPGGTTHAKGSPALIAMHAGSSRMAPPGQAVVVALAGRRLARLADKHGRPVMTDRVMASYRDTLEEELREFAQRVWDCGETGLALGVRWISAGQLESALQEVPRGETPRLRVDTARRFSADRLRHFVESERALLEDGGGGRGTSPAEPDPGLGSLLQDADYTWAHFPDEPDLAAPGPGFVARARVAALYYAERLRRVESVL